MSLLSILRIGQSGTTVSQTAVRVAGDNVANASTPGYRRRELAIQSTPGYRSGGLMLGAGARVDDQIRLANDVMSARLRLAGSDAAAADVRSEILQRANNVLGEVGQEGLTSALDKLLTSFDSLAATPHDLTVRNDVLAAAEDFVYQVNTTATEVGRIAADVNSEIAVEIQQLGAMLSELEQLDDRLPLKDASDLDRRDVLLQEISEIADTNVVFDPNGRPTIYLSSVGTAIFSDGVASNVGTTIAAGGTRRVTVQTSAGTVDVTSNIGGKIGGLVQARDVDVAGFGTDLDNAVFEIANAINAIHSAGFGLDAVGGRNLFTVGATAPGTAQLITVDPAITGQPNRLAAATDPLLVPGDNRNALQLAQLRETPLASGYRAQDSLNNVISTFGLTVYRADRATESLRDTKDRLAIMHDQLVGVSIDEEMTKLMQYQQTYAAAASVVRTADELLSELISLKR
ncbi:MAG: flagellar hook-associated protein FlgK [Deltaproteobacteria bacterium]